MAHHGKRVVKGREGIDRNKLYPIAEAVSMIKERANAKFDETIELAMNLGVDPRHERVNSVFERLFDLGFYRPGA